MLNLHILKEMENQYNGLTFHNHYRKHVLTLSPYVFVTQLFDPFKQTDYAIGITKA